VQKLLSRNVLESMGFESLDGLIEYVESGNHGNIVTWQAVADHFEIEVRFFQKTHYGK
jgi:hypothetical protein